MRNLFSAAMSAIGLLGGAESLLSQVDLVPVASGFNSPSADSDVADAASTKTILEIKQDFATRNGGDIHFGPDGYLYIATGDGGSGGDPNDHAQDRSRLLGKVLRIDVDGSGSGQCGFEADYGIPADNPYVGQVGCDEIWAYGFKNPWRWSFDCETGDILIGDVGQDGLEEIDFQPASSTGGENYEWGCREGNTDHPGNCRGPGPRTPSILDYDHGDGHEPPSGCAAVTGGYRYRDSYDELRGTYIYADFCSGIVWFANDDQGSWQTRVWRDTDLLISSFGEDDDGEIYLADYSGTIYQLKVVPEIFSDGFESGDTALWKSLSP
jgi:hypothetical protein